MIRELVWLLQHMTQEAIDSSHPEGGVYETMERYASSRGSERRTMERRRTGADGADQSDQL